MGKYIGYLPQDVELFKATIAENLSRFMPVASSGSVIATANAAAVHDLILFAQMKGMAGPQTRQTLRIPACRWLR